MIHFLLEIRQNVIRIVHIVRKFLALRPLFVAKSFESYFVENESHFVAAFFPQQAVCILGEHHQIVFRTKAQADTQ